MRKVKDVKRVAHKHRTEHTPRKVLMNWTSRGFRYMFWHGGAQSRAPRNELPWPGPVFSWRGHQKPRSRPEDKELLDVVTSTAETVEPWHDSNLKNQQHAHYRSENIHREPRDLTNHLSFNNQYFNKQAISFIIIIPLHLCFLQNITAFRISITSHAWWSIFTVSLILFQTSNFFTSLKRHKMSTEEKCAIFVTFEC